MFTLEKGVSPNVVRVKIDCNKTKEHWFLLRSDAHHDNPHCNWDLEKKHLDEALERDAGILDCGDLFCAMQGAWDPRKSKSCLRSEHQRSDYLDALVTTAADFYQPYAKNIVCLGQGNHECVDPETEVLTRRGWVKFPEVLESDDIATMHNFTREVIWSKPIRLHKYEYDGPMYYVNHRSCNMMVTPNHRIAYFTQKTAELRYKRADEIFLEGASTSVANVPVTGLSGNTDYPLSDVEIRLAAWILSDGSIPKTEGANASYIYQSKLEGIEKIKSLLEQAGWDFTESVRSDRPLPPGIKTMKAQHVFTVHTRLHYLFGVGKKRVLPDWVGQLSDRQFEVFIQSYIDGDGTRRKEPNQTATAIYGTKEMLDSLHAECCTHGLRSSISWRNVKNKPGHWVLNVAWRDNTTLRSANPKIIQYSGQVYCLTTQTGNFFMRREGRVCVTGNSSILKRHESNLTERLAQALRDRTGALVPVTGYTGWVKFQFTVANRVTTARTLWHCHGYGGGGPVTVDNIQAQRQNAYIEGADIMFSGHTHDRWAREFCKVGLTQDGEVFQRSLWYVKSASYKNEYNEGAGGWHVETGKPPKPLGAWWLKMTLYKEKVKGTAHTRVLTELIPAN